jgi:hypothetical protein
MNIRLCLSVLLILGLTNVMAVDIAQVPPGVLADDPYMLEFMQTVKTDLVQFKDGILNIYVKPSGAPVLLALLGAFGSGMGAALILSNSNKNEVVAAFVLAGGCVAGAVGLTWLALKTAQRKAFDKPPYIVLNNEGVTMVTGAKVGWHDIAYLEREKIVVYDEIGFVDDQKLNLHLQNKFRTTLLSVSGLGLPISFDNFVALVEHYWQCNTNGETQTA